MGRGGELGCGVVGVRKRCGELCRGEWGCVPGSVCGDVWVYVWKSVSVYVWGVCRSVWGV